VLVILVQAIAFREVINVRHQSSANRAKQVPGFHFFNYFFLLLSFFYFYTPTIAIYLREKLPTQPLETFLKYHPFISFMLYSFGFVAFVLSLAPGKYKLQFKQFAWTVMALVVIVAQSSVLFTNIFDGIIWFLVPCCAIVFNDIMAFFSGLLFGRKFIKKPFLSLSPNKTWEGFLGAAIWTVFFAYVFAGFLAKYDWFICPKTVYSVGINELTCTRDPMFIFSILRSSYFHQQRIQQHCTNTNHQT